MNMALTAVDVQEDPVHTRGPQTIKKLVLIILKKGNAVRQDLAFHLLALNESDDFGELRMQSGFTAQKSDRLEIPFLEGQLDLSLDPGQRLHRAAVERIAEPAADIAGPVGFNRSVRSLPERVLEGPDP
jgi:hypothetical protein